MHVCIGVTLRYGKKNLSEGLTHELRAEEREGYGRAEAGGEDTCPGDTKSINLRNRKHNPRNRSNWDAREQRS